MRARTGWKGEQEGPSGSKFRYLSGQLKHSHIGELEIQRSIVKALDKMSQVQQLKLLEFIKSMLAVSKGEKPKGLLQFAGIFDNRDTQDFENALKDCSKS